ncbi:hypothetical protein EV193_105175 [Herbihabitans rhizosphaerae]|uniref:Uncharacterized protein n=1 Tax=Herbihabitans rhizosphaerae TaxID=1872711 RepID=A0A4Q7KMU6_9PSEU|nr:hypothetical protein [Herbihabitans rhizosphaerae]RZS37617.1 hypothetical protein EV193_105175 [Herbihabitans rhizosphaerae]
MTNQGRGLGASGPPWSIDVLADLHAGALDPDLTASLWPQVNADPEAREILAALDSTKVDLGGLSAAPLEPMPAHFAARLDAAIEAESAARAAAMAGQQQAAPPQQPGVAPVVSLDDARRRRNRRMTIAGGVFAAAAAAAAITIAVVPGNETDGTGVAAPTSNTTAPPSDGPLALDGDSLGKQQGAILSQKNYGALGSEQRFSQCLAAAGVPATVKPLGAREATFQGKPGVAAVIPVVGAGGTKFRIVVVDAQCGPALLGDTTIG